MGVSKMDYCIHDDTCKVIKNALTDHYLFRCPLVIEVDDDNYPKIKEDGWEFLEEQKEWVFKL